MAKTAKRFTTLATLIILLAVFAAAPLLATTTVSSQTLVIRVTIPERTTLSFSDAGDIMFTSNNPAALLNVQQNGASTLLSVTAK